jgi:hypothetical protein
VANRAGLTIAGGTNSRTRFAQTQMRVGRMLADVGLDTRLIQDFFSHHEMRNAVQYPSLSPQRLVIVRVR